MVFPDPAMMLAAIGKLVHHTPFSMLNTENYEDAPRSRHSEPARPAAFATTYATPILSRSVMVATWPIYFDRTGICLLAKRLEDETSAGHSFTHRVVGLTAAQPPALAEGLDWRRVQEGPPAAAHWTTVATLRP
ncbi:IS66 family insertion sequence element accessory protein TnpB [Camelimonas abortus]|uniref:IS66 family insertion sequence element accessory protein TnpB n=1 Tax=Camelimonas abortus TaxID=1017184 RepID=A0ABV7LDM8_9HYPH